jgi:hypothetical protein
MARFFDRWFGPKAAPPPQRPVPRVNAYQAVAVIPCAKACAAARESAGQRFLARRAPVLPLAGCDQPAQCTCKFRKYEDRRVGPQRTPYASMLVRSYPGQEKRKSPGRRAGDR